MSLRDELITFNKFFVSQLSDDILTRLTDATETLVRSGLSDQAIKIADVAPVFDLPELGEGSFALSEAVKSGPVVITFYRGVWCPYCNLEMQALQQALPEIKAAGGSLVAIAPELPEHAAQIRDKGNLSFPLLYDRDNNVARQYGLVFTFPEELRPIYESFGIDLVASQGNENFELPVPATYIIDRNGVVVHAFIDVDYSKRMEPSEIIEILERL